MTNCKCDGIAPSWAGKDVLAMITGATRGYGVSLAEELIRVLCAYEETAPKSISLFLIGRSQESLLKTKKAVESVTHKSSTKLDVIVNEALLFDLATATEQDMEKCISVYDQYANKFESNNELHLLFNNAATIGDVDKKSFELNDLARLDKYARINLTSMIAFTSMFLQCVKPVHESTNQQNRCVCIINVSSLCGLLPFKHMAEYCSLKAARIMFMRCLATDRDDISLFNYSPGSMKTDMLTEVTSAMKDEETLKKLQEMVLDPNDSARECISWLGFLGTPCSAKRGNLCPKHHTDFLGLFTGTQLDFHDAKELANPFRISQVTNAG